MKKTISLLLCAALLLAAAGLSSCSNTQKGSVTPTDATTADVAPTDETTEFVPTVNPVTYGEHISLTADNASPAPGDTVTVTLHMEGIENVASFDVLVSSSDNAVMQSCAEKDVADFYTNVAELPEGAQFGAYVAATANIDSLDMFTVTYTVSEDAKPGDELKFEADFTLFDIGTTPSGDRTYRCEDYFTVEPLVLTVQG